MDFYLNYLYHMHKNDKICLFKDSEPDVNQVMPNLFLGNVRIASNTDFLHKNNIGTVIRILENDDGTRELSIIPKRIDSINYYIIPIRDVDVCLRDINHLLDKTSEIIKDSLKNNVPVLVHCKKGHHRSAVVVGAFMMKYLNTDFISTVKYINDHRKCAFRRDTCMVRSMFKYHKYMLGEECHRIVPFKDERSNVYNYMSY